MPDIIAATTDGDIFVQVSPYSSARSATTGTVSGTTGATNSAGIVRFGSRGGSPPVRIRRLFLDFDTEALELIRFHSFLVQ